MPIGVPSDDADDGHDELPTMAFSRPPALPGGGVISVKTASDEAADAFQSSAPRISASHQAEGGGGQRQRHPDGIAARGAVAGKALLVHAMISALLLRGAAACSRARPAR